MNTAQQLIANAKTLADQTFAARAADVDASENYPRDNVADLTREGLMGMTIAREFGGRGLGLTDALRVVEQIARACGATGRIVVEANMGAIGAIMHYGNRAQKELAAQLVLGGDKPAICITEPDAGSAANEMTTRADKRGDRFIINGKKHWITGGGVSKLHLIFARVFENNRAQGIAGFIGIKGASGLTIGKREPAMGLRGIPETEILFDNLEVPTEMALLNDDGAPLGFNKLMTAYNAQRLGAAAVALGIAQGAFEHALAYATHRHQFGRPIGEFQGVQWMLADMSIALDAARALLHQAADSAAPFPDRRLSAQAKIFAAESAVKITNDALQLHGAAGYSRERPLERMVRDARMFTIGGGTAQILRTQVGGALLGIKTPQGRGGYLGGDGRS